MRCIDIRTLPRNIPLFGFCILCLIHLNACGVLQADANVQENAQISSTPTTNKGVNMTSAITPVWRDINSRHTPDELLEKIMKLANRAWVTPAEIEEIFGIKFKSPYLSKGSVGNVFIAVGDTTQYGDSFKLFHDEKRKTWTLILSEFGVGREDGECIRFGKALKTVLNMGWKEERLISQVVEYEYVKRTDDLHSRLGMDNRHVKKEGDCLNWIQFTNGPAVAK